MAPSAASPLAGLSEQEVRMVLLRAGLAETDLDSAAFARGKGGVGTAYKVGVISSLGGMLFGLDLGYISGVVTSSAAYSQDINGTPQLSDSIVGLITGSFAVGAIFAVFPALLSRLLDLVGRKGCLILGGLVFVIGATLQGLASDLGVTFAGRFLVGAAVGLLSGTVPMYLGEIAPPSHRGTIGAFFNVALTLGEVTSFFLAKIFSNTPHGWRYAALFQVVPGACLAAGGIFMPGSPRWLVAKGRARDALLALVSVRGPDDDPRLELAEILNEFERELGHGRASLKDLFRGLNGWLLLMGSIVMVLQQLCGLNMFIYYGPKIFQRIFDSSNASLIFTAISLAVNVSSTVASVFCVDRFGRVRLLTFSFVGMALCCVVLAGVGLACFGDASGSVVTPCSCGDWAKYTAAGAVFAFIASFAIGVGPVVWIYCAEIFPLMYRNLANGITTDLNWVGNFIIGFSPPWLIDHLGWHTYWLFAGLNVLGVVACWTLPETKGRSLEDIQTMFERWYAGQARSVHGRVAGSGALVVNEPAASANC